MANPPPPGRRRAFSSPRAWLFIGSQKIGWATGFRMRPSVNATDIRVFGSIYRERAEPVDASGSGSFDYIHMLWAPLAGFKEGTYQLWANQLMTTLQWIDYEPPPITLIDMVTKKEVCTIQGMFPESEDFSLSQGGLMQKNCNFTFNRAFEHSLPIAP